MCLEVKDVADDVKVQSAVVGGEHDANWQPYAEVLEGYAVQVGEQCQYAYVLEQREEEDDPYDPEYHG